MFLNSHSRSGDPRGLRERGWCPAALLLGKQPHIHLEKLRNFQMA